MSARSLQTHSPEAVAPAKSRRRLHWAEARALHRLLCDGAPPRRFNVSRGPCMRDASTRRPFPDSYVDPGTWRPAREWDPETKEVRNRTLTVADLAHHLAGSWDVAVEAPSWTSCLVFDIDRHLPWMAEHCRGEVQEATRQRDRTLTALWRALGFGPDKQPVIVQTPSGGYHVYLPLLRDTPAGTEGRWPNAAMRRYVEHQLLAAGLELKPGVLELYPSGVPLRAPCGRTTLLVYATRPGDPENLGLDLVEGTYRGEPEEGDLTWSGGQLQPQFSARRNVPGMVGAFIEAIEATRRPLGEWLGTGPLWHPTWGPFGAVSVTNENLSAPPVSPTISRSSPPVRGAAGRGASAWLLRGPAFYARVSDLLDNGLTQPGERHDAALKLAFYWGAVRALPPFEVLARLNTWLRAFPHRSRLRDLSESRFVDETLAEAWHYYRHHVVHCVGRVPTCPPEGLGSLEPAEEALFRDEGAPDAWPGVRAVLAFLGRLADSGGVVGQPVELSHRLLIKLCGDRRVVRDGQRRRLYRVALDELQRLGVLTLHRGYRVGVRGRQFSVWYRFGSAELPQVTASGDRLLGVRAVSEGLLCALAAGDGSLRVVLEIERRMLPEAMEARQGGAWWARMFAARVFTVAEFLHADESKAIPGPWSWRRAGQGVEVRVLGSRFESASRAPPPLSPPVSPAQLRLPFVTA